MGVIADTSIWIDLERGFLRAADLEAAVEGDDVFVAPVTFAEMEYGFRRARGREQRSQRAAALAAIKARPCLAITDQTGEIFGRVAADLDSSGRPSKHRTQDLWIASLALQHGFKVLTQNRRDFDDIPGLTVLSLSP
ncbi:MAG TPA: PIN domain-containing protein [Planctomycetota bacterium]|nr:PIN domain-containing protein [Planctomycetota bacterium]